MGFWVSGSRVQSPGCRVQGAGCRVQGPEMRVRRAGCTSTQRPSGTVPLGTTLPCLGGSYGAQRGVCEHTPRFVRRGTQWQHVLRGVRGAVLALVLRQENTSLSDAGTHRREKRPHQRDILAPTRWGPRWVWGLGFRRSPGRSTRQGGHTSRQGAVIHHVF